MAQRAMGTGSISFGLVTVPIKLFTGARSKSVSFNMLHAKDNSRLRQQLVCQTCGEVVERKDTVKGYEHCKGEYVVMTDEEIKGLQAVSDQAIEIQEFVPIFEVDPVYFDKSYLLGPDKGGSKSYRLLREAMDKSGRVAIGRYSSKGKQQLVVIRPVLEGLMLHTLFYHDEVRTFEGIEIDEVALKENEIDLAISLVESFTQDKFDGSKFEDNYRKAVLGVIEKKAAGEIVTIAPKAEGPTQVLDLVAALKASIEQKKAS